MRVKQKHYSYNFSTKKSRKVDLTKTIFGVVASSGFANGLITVYTPYPDCSIVLEKVGGEARDLGVSLTIPFFGRKPILRQAKVFLVDNGGGSARRRVHLVVFGE